MSNNYKQSDRGVDFRVTSSSGIGNNIRDVTVEKESCGNSEF